MSGGGKLGQVGGSIVGLWLSTFRVNVRLNRSQGEIYIGGEEEIGLGAAN